MKYSALFGFLFIYLAIAVEKSYAKGGLTCKRSDAELNIPTLSNMNSVCTEKMRGQIQKELAASMTYLAMGSHFLQYNVNRPGFANFFLESASEERQHAIKLIDYLLMRGELTLQEDPNKANSQQNRPINQGAPTDQLKGLINNPRPKNGITAWQNGTDALRAALTLEKEVTKNIRDIIVDCEGNENDYHLVDWLTGDFLDEQYKGQRDLAAKISTLSKMRTAHGELGEFLYDKTLL